MGSMFAFRAVDYGVAPTQRLSNKLVFVASPLSIKGVKENWLVPNQE
jgi:hypothetical protein